MAGKETTFKLTLKMVSAQAVMILTRINLMQIMKKCFSLQLIRLK